MGMIPFSFWHEHTFADFQRKAFYFFKNKHESFKDDWEKIRQLVFVTACVNGSKVSAHELMPFSWDKEHQISKKVAKPITKEEVSKILKQFNINRN